MRASIRNYISQQYDPSNVLSPEHYFMGGIVEGTVSKLTYYCLFSVISKVFQRQVFFLTVQNMVAYVMLVTVIFVLVYSLTISEEAVTFPDTSCFIPC